LKPPERLDEGKNMAKLRVAAAALAAALTLAGCTQTDEAASAPPREVQQVFELTPAVIAMRWQLLNPEVNSFTFRETKNVFEYRDVRRGAEAWKLPDAEGFAVPEGYEAWAERTFTNAFLVLRDGKIVFEDYRNRMTPETRHIGFSMTKTITAMLVGQALERGEIESLDDPVSKYVPELAKGGYGQATIRNVLEMRSGADIEERYDFGANPSLAGRIHETAIIRNEARFADFAVDLGSRAAPGSTFNYATLDTAVLGWVLEKATGETLEDLMESRVWQPLGAEFDGFFIADGPPGTGRSLNGMGFNATLRDFARIGQMMLDGGVADGTRVLPEGWVAQMTSMKPTGGGPFPGYGFQTWQVDNEPDAYAAVGLAGQMIYVHPASRTVIVKLSYHPPVPPANVESDTIAFFKAVASVPNP
jgi:CubicO group peptidase (beta-lactamase class C family)